MRTYHIEVKNNWPKYPKVPICGAWRVSSTDLMYWVVRGDDAHERVSGWAYDGRKVQLTDRVCSKCLAALGYESLQELYAEQALAEEG
jgi:hypothetical protein